MYSDQECLRPPPNTTTTTLSAPTTNTDSYLHRSNGFFCHVLRLQVRPYHCHEPRNSTTHHVSVDNQTITTTTNPPRALLLCLRCASPTSGIRVYIIATTCRRQPRDGTTTYACSCSRRTRSTALQPPLPATPCQRSGQPGHRSPTSPRHILGLMFSFVAQAQGANRNHRCSYLRPELGQLVTKVAHVCGNSNDQRSAEQVLGYPVPYRRYPRA